MRELWRSSLFIARKGRPVIAMNRLFSTQKVTPTNACSQLPFIISFSLFFYVTIHTRCISLFQRLWECPLHSVNFLQKNTSKQKQILKTIDGFVCTVFGLCVSPLLLGIFTMRTFVLLANVPLSGFVTPTGNQRRLQNDQTRKHISHTQLYFSFLYIGSPL